MKKGITITTLALFFNIGSVILSAPIANNFILDSDEVHSRSSGLVAGAVTGTLVILVGATIVTMVSIYLILKWRTHKREINLQMDIFAKYTTLLC